MDYKDEVRKLERKIERGEFPIVYPPGVQDAIKAARRKRQKLTENIAIGVISLLTGFVVVVIGVLAWTK